MRLSEARVVLTGASGGIGLAIAGALCAQGAKVLAVARHGDPLAHLLELYPQHLCWVAADLTFLADRRKVLVAAQAIGGINLLINAAGVNHFAMLEQLDDSEINAMLAVNISAPICLTKTLLPLLKEAESAMVVMSAPPMARSATPALPATAPLNSPCAGSPKPCAASWPIPGSACCMSLHGPPAPA